MSFLDRIDACNTYDLSHFVPFQINQQTLGWIKPSFAETLKKSPSIFGVQEHAITFSAELDSADTRSAAAQPAATARKLADALFKGFPGESGRTISVQ